MSLAENLNWITCSEKGGISPQLIKHLDVIEHLMCNLNIFKYSPQVLATSRGPGRRASVSPGQ